MGMIARLTQVLRSLYCSYKYLQFFHFTIRKLGTHCLGQWVQCLFKQIPVLQQRVLRLLYLIDRGDHVTPLFVKEKILPALPLL